MIRLPAAGLVMALTVAACGGAADDGADRGEVLVSAAASLTDAFREIETAFEEANPEIDVVLNLAGSSLLREQILAGAPVDVFAPASLDIMRQVGDAGHLDDPFRVFARNGMAIAVPAGNPGGIGGLDDLQRDALLVGLCAESVPCGDLAHRMLTGAGIRPILDTEEPNVRALLTKVAQAELDVGIVYRTDLASTGQVEEITIPEEYGVAVEYPIAVMGGSTNRAGADAFVSYVLSGEGGRILDRHGFLRP